MNIYISVLHFFKVKKHLLSQGDLGAYALLVLNLKVIWMPYLNILFRIHLFNFYPVLLFLLVKHRMS